MKHSIKYEKVTTSLTSPQGICEQTPHLSDQDSITIAKGLILGPMYLPALRRLTGVLWCW